ncbi:MULTISPECIES: aspartate-alanine antiporter [Paraburkholderia]|uniref:Aspartate-alanine antiporter n=1 Tax=Paraburkholderia tropica TaxID=92647 RepID=A0A1A5XP77_9BURK|nr:MULTISPECIES: aspartate-alanine antiporter [Paraburkholderia]MBB2977373.1 aspartate-alanine antiporter [Paraburkholderia tropica]MBB2997762.1 aspartate-alanine antiporter [Paraburkholderia tropica]MBB6316784.1 aspartate-alanine antiporter [Paraburkholderia tropica]MDE1141970.1 aspartate-alanine antiporter [Paraburkholderia tropica]OBR54935.1 aspartate-alanine antiporter [Paraburkholderia tropica]
MIVELLKSQPEIALFTSLALGYLIGSIRFGPISLGGVCGTLIVALLLGQTGARIAPDLKNIAFALFIFALGFTGGPQFFANIGKGWRYGLLSIVEIVSVMTLVMIAVVLMKLDAGTAAGLLAGAATESAVIGTASEAIARLGISPEAVGTLQAHIVTAYSVSYLFGLITIVLFTSQVAPLILRVNLRDEAARLFRKLGGDGVLDEGQRLALPPLVGRAFRAGPAAGIQVAQFEARFGNNITVERVLREQRQIDADGQLVLQSGDVVFIAGRRESMVDASASLGEEVSGEGFTKLLAQRVDVMLTRRDADGLTLAQMRERASAQAGRGIYVSAITRLDTTVPALPGTVVRRGDVLTLLGAPSDVKRGAQRLGYVIQQTTKTDFVYLGLGVLVGMLIGRFGLKVGGVSLVLGTGGGCLLSGLLFGWARSHFPVVGSLPSAAAQVLKDFGLATFIAAVGLSAGPDAIKLVREYGLALPLAGILMVLIPGLLSLWIGRMFLKLEAPMLLGAIAGQQCSTPAISALVGVTGNSTPVIGYTITYALSNILLPLMGPVVVGLAAKFG